MANKTLFSSLKSLLPRTNSVNEAGGLAYELTPKHALAQMAERSICRQVAVGFDRKRSKPARRAADGWVYANRAFAYGTHGSTGVMTEWQAFVKNQVRLSPKFMQSV